MHLDRETARDVERDRLLQPSLQDVPRGVPSSRPWRLSPQFWVALFGGALGVAAFAWENARRLGAPPATRVWIAATGAAGTAVSTAVLVVLSDAAGSGYRIGYSVVGVLTALVLYRLQRSPDRIYEVRTSSVDVERYGPALGPGVAAVLLGAIVQAVIVALIAA